MKRNRVLGILLSIMLLVADVAPLHTVFAEEALPQQEEAVQTEANSAPAEEQQKESMARKLAKGTVFYGDKELTKTVGVLEKAAVVLLVSKGKTAAKISYAIKKDGKKIVKNAWVEKGALKKTDAADLTEDQLKAVTFVAKKTAEEAKAEPEAVKEPETKAEDKKEAPAAEAPAKESTKWKAAPTIKKIEQTGAGKVRIVWTAKEAAEEYIVYQVKDGEYKALKTVSGSMAASLTNIGAGKVSFAVRGRKNGDGRKIYGAYSETVEFDVKEGWKLAPVISTLKQTGDGQVQIAWTVKEKAEKYVVYEIIGDERKAVKTVNGATEATLENVSAGKHTYAVRAKQTVNEKAVNGSFSEAADVTVKEEEDTPERYADEAWKQAPTIKSVKQNGNGTVVLEWTAASGANPDSYQVMEVKNGKYTGVKSTTNKSTITLTGVSAGAHTYAVRGRKKVNGTMQSGKNSATKKITVVEAWKQAPTIKSVKQTADGTVTLEWTAAPDAKPDSYQVMELVDGKYKGIKTTTKLTVTLTGVTKGAHTYAVRGRKKVNGSLVGGVNSATKKITVVEAWKQAPTITSITQTSAGTVKLVWTVPADANPESFQVLELVDGKYKGVKTTTNKSTTTLTNVSLGTHTYVVRGRKKVNGSLVSGVNSDQVKFTVVEAWKVAPTLTAITQTGGGTVKLEWTAASGANPDSYQVLEFVNGKYNGVKTTTNKSTATLTGVSLGTHTYVVRGRKKVSGSLQSGVNSERMNIKVVEAWKVGPTIKSITQTAEGTITIELTPAPGADPDGYQVMEYANDKYNGVKTVGKTTTITLTNVSVGTHIYAVRPRKKVNGTFEYGSKSEQAETFVKVIESARVGDFTYGAIEGKEKELQVVKYHGTAASVTVPEKVIENYYTVTRIGDEAFMGNTGMTSVDLPDTITEIGKRAFKDCVNLAHME